MTATRLLAALVGLVVVVPVLVWGGVAGADGLVAAAALWSLLEYSRMAFPTDRAVAFVLLVAGWAAVHGSLLYGTDDALSAALIAVTAGALTYATFRPGASLDGAADRAARLVTGIAWLSLLTFLALLRREPLGLAWVFAVLAVAWLGDTGAYFAGRAFGRHALYPRVSPKKTWEGAVGGITLATAGLFVARELGLSALSVTDVLILGPLLSSVGVVGDLAESMVKRSFQVKDAGWIMPGHGGLLDRIDSLLFTAPVTWLWVRFVEGR